MPASVVRTCRSLEPQQAKCSNFLRNIDSVLPKDVGSGLLYAEINASLLEPQITYLPGIAYLSDTALLPCIIGDTTLGGENFIDTVD